MNSEELKNIVVFISKNINEETCPICMELLKDDICKTECMHAYHFNCLSEWVKESNSCCLCKHKLFIEFEIKDEDEYEDEENENFDNPVDEAVRAIINKWASKNIDFPSSHSEKLKNNVEFKLLPSISIIDENTIVTKELLNSYIYTKEQLNEIDLEKKMYLEFLEDGLKMRKMRSIMNSEHCSEFSVWSSDSSFDFDDIIHDSIINLKSSIYSYETIILYDMKEFNEVCHVNEKFLSKLDKKNYLTYILCILANRKIYDKIYEITIDGDIFGKTVEECSNIINIEI
jgi:hypothetical protein